MKCDLTNRGIDRGYGIIIVCSSFCLITITDGILFSFGILMVELIEEFNKDRATSAIIGSILIGFCGFSGPFGGGLCNKYGYRTTAIVGSFVSCTGLFISYFATSLYFLYFSYGCLGGAGLGLVYMTANIINVHYFSKYRGLACGIALCGSGVGSFAFNQVYRILIHEYGWRGTVLNQSGVCLQCLVFVLFLLPPTKDDKSETLASQMTIVSIISDGESDNVRRKVDNCAHENDVDREVDSIDNNRKNERSTNNSSTEHHKEKERTKQFCIMRNPCLKYLFKEYFDTKLLTDMRFWIFILSTIIVHLAFSVVVHMTADSAVESGMSKFEASWLASSIGIAGSFGRIVFGLLADRVNFSIILIVFGLLVAAGICIGITFLLTSFNTRLIGTVLYGFFIGGHVTTCPLVLVELFSPAMIEKTFGLYFFAVGLSALAFTPIGGLLFDKTGNYDVTFVVAGSELIVAGLVILLLKVIKKKGENSS